MKIRIDALVVVLLQLATFATQGQHITRPNVEGPGGVFVNSYSGNLFYQRRDLILAGRGSDLNIEFSYNSSNDTLDFGYGMGWTMTYGMSYYFDSLDIVLVRMDGRKDRYKQVSNGYVPPAGVFDSLSFYEQDRLKLVTKFGMRYYFDDSSHKKLTKIEDLNGNEIIIQYSGQYPASIANSSGKTVLLHWEDGHLSSISDNNGDALRRIEMEYDDQYLISVRDPLNYEEKYAYGNNGKIVTLTDKRNNPIKIEYADGKVVLLSSCISDMKFTYVRPKTYVTRNSGSSTQLSIYGFDDKGKIVRLIDPGKCTLQYEYDNDNNLVKYVNKKGNPTAFTYDDRGNITAQTDALGNSIYRTYSQYSKPLTVTDKRGNITSFTYDENMNLVQMIQPEGAVYSMDYDDNGNLIRVINPIGQETNMLYNAIGELTTIHYPNGSEIFEYNSRGNIVKSIDANGNSTLAEYDDLDRIVKMIDPRNKTTYYSYNENGFIQSETDPKGNTTTYSYDEVGHLTEVSTPTGSSRYQYDKIGNLVEIIDALGNTTSFKYDLKNLPIAVVDPNGKAKHLEYDNNGNLIRLTDPKGNTTEFQYDALDRLVSRIYPENEDLFAYDKDDNLVQAINNEIVISFSYDGMNRLIKKSIDTWQKEIFYTYDEMSNRKTMTDPSGGTTRYLYDNDNRIIEIETPGGEIANFEYDVKGRLGKLINGNGTVSMYNYDDMDHLLSISHKNSSGEIISSFSYEYDDFGNRTVMVDQDNDTTRYSYDAVNRLSSVNYPDSSFETFDLDAVGNRVLLTNDTGSISYSYSQAGELLTAEETDYVFDLNGNMIKKIDSQDTTHYYYDTRDRLIKIVLPNGNFHNFKYDPFGKRIEFQKNNQSELKYVYDLGNVLQELDPNNSKVAQYTSLLELDSRIAMERGGNFYVYHKDGLGSITEISNSAEQIENQYRYDAFGKISYQLGSLENTYTFTGRPYNAESDLYDYRTRFYDAKNGRFLSRDQFSGALSLPLSLNKYLYAHANPVNYVDATGEFVCGGWCLLGIGLAGYGLYNTFNFFKNAGERMEEGNKRAQAINEALRRGDLENAARLMEEHRRKTLQDAGKSLKEGASVPGTSLSPITGNAAFDNTAGLLGLLNDIYDKLFGDDPDSDDGPDDDADDNGDQEDPFNNDNNGDDGMEFSIPRLHAVDPNDIIGETGYDTAQWISINDRIGYTIRYENDPEFATAPAQIVRISSPIGPHLNINSFRLGTFGFGQFIFEVPDNASFYAKRLDVTDSLGVYVDVTAGIDVNKNEVFWIFESVDPATNLPPEDALTGFLPVNDTTVTIYTDTITQRGEGFVNFTILPHASSMTGDSINQQATIIFDQNAPIPTNIWTNIIDALPPSSTMDTLPDNVPANTVQLNWSAEDDPGGVGEHLYDLYVSRDGAQYYLYQEDIDTTSFTFQGILGSSYAFYVRSSDYVGNKEEQKFTEDESTFLGELDAITLVEPVLDDIFCENDQMAVEWEVNGNISLVNIKLIREDTQEEILVAADVVAEASPYNFTIPAEVVGGLAYSLSVSDAGDLEAGANASIFIASVDTTMVEVAVCDPANVGMTTESLVNQYGCDSLVMVNYVLDNVPPKANCPEQFEANLTGIGSASVDLNDIDLGSTDNCGIASRTLSRTDFQCMDYSNPTTTTLTVTDNFGNQATCTTIIVLNDPVGLCNCDGEELTPNDDPVASGIYVAKVSITSNGKVNTGGSVTFKAGNFIKLEDGFRIQPGAFFWAKIDDCVIENSTALPEAIDFPVESRPLSMTVAPNPFRRSTTIRFYLPERTEAGLNIYDVNGRLVRRLQPRSLLEAGQQEFLFEGDQLAAGMYYAILVAGEETINRRIILTH